MLDARDSYGTKSIRHQRRRARSEQKLRHGRYEVVVRDDIGRIRDIESGEVMHSVNDPAEEARSLYVEQSHLVERLKIADAHPLVVWDVGSAPPRMRWRRFTPRKR